MAGRRSSTAPSITKPKPKKQKARRSLNALAIAEQQNPTRTKIRRSRLGQSEPKATKRKRVNHEDVLEPEEEGGKVKRLKAGDRDRYGNEIEKDSDSSGNQWVVGQVDDDSDLDSDEAMGASDVEELKDFTFGGSSSATSRNKPRNRSSGSQAEREDLQDIDLQEHGEKNAIWNSESDGFRDEAVDLATMLDDSDHDDRLTSEFQGPGVVDERYSGSDEDTSQGEEDSTFLFSENEDEPGESAELASLQALMSSMNEQDQSTARARPIDTQETMTPSEFGLSSKRKLTVEDMIPSVTDPRFRKSLNLLANNDTKPSGKRGGVPKKLDVPLPKRQQDRLDRAAAYDKSKETLNRWIDTVKHNRRAEHISFPLRDPNAIAARGSQRMLPTSHSQPLTDLESTIQNILRDNGLLGLNGKSEENQLQAFEELQMNKMPLEEVQARRAELRKSRELLFREEIRAKRIKKIKSKSYRKVHRKERERIAQRERSALTAAGVDDSESEQERNDRRRAEERMGARHRESRWAKGVKDSGRAKWDEDARSGVTEMAKRGEDLRRRIEGKAVTADEDGMASSESWSDSEDDDGSGDGTQKLENRLQVLKGNGQELDPDGRSSRLASMDFMKRAEASRKARNDADVESLRRDLAGEETPSEEESEGQGRKTYGPANRQTLPVETPKPKQKSEFEEAQGSDSDDGADQDGREGEDVEIVIDTRGDQSKSPSAEKSLLGEKQKKKSPRTKSSLTQETSENPWLVSSKKDASGSRRRIPDADVGAIISNSPTIGVVAAPSLNAKPRSALKGSREAEAARRNLEPSGPKVSIVEPNSEVEDDETDPQPFILRNQDLVRKAFAGDEVVADFEKEKIKTMQEDEDKIIDDSLPGWGSWVGAGIGKKAQKRTQQRNGSKHLTKEPGIAKEKRQDAKLERVIINEKRVKKNAKYLASSLPHPFETRQQYESSLRLPVGPEWTTKETFQSATKPRVLMKQGIIRPLRKPII